MNRIIFHIDVNSAFLSWSALNLLKEKPDSIDIRTIPAIIGGDQQTRHGIVVAKSLSAKKIYHIQTAEPVASAMKKCPTLTIIPPDHQLYAKCSKQFIDFLKSLTPDIEQVSIDECFADFSGTHRIYPDPIALAHTIKDKIRNELGFTVNVGIGECKLLAKMASDFEKPDKVHTLYRNEIPQKMWPLKVGELYSVGHATAEKLERAKICTIGDLANTDVARVQRIVGQKMGKQIHDYANGIDPSVVLAEPEEAKGYSISTTLEEDVTKATQAYPVLLALADSVTARIRSDGAKAYCIAVSIRSNDFKTKSHQRSLMSPTDISQEVYEISKELFDELWDGVTPLRLLGIAMTNITREETVQFSLFPDEKKEKARKIDKAKDALNAKFGSATVVRGSSIQAKLDVGKKYQAQIEQKKKENDHE